MRRAIGAVEIALDIEQPILVDDAELGLLEEPVGDLVAQTRAWADDRDQRIGHEHGADPIGRDVAPADDQDPTATQLPGQDQAATAFDGRILRHRRALLREQAMQATPRVGGARRSAGDRDAAAGADGRGGPLKSPALGER